MRKQQEKLLEKAKKKGFVQKQMEVLSREDFTILELQTIFQYFIAQKRNLDASGDVLAEEVNRCMVYLKQKGSSMPHTYYERLLYAVLPIYYDKDTLIGSKKKYQIVKMYQYILDKLSEEQFYNVFNLYTYMLYSDFPAYHINLLLHYILTGKKNGDDIRRMLDSYPCLENDFLYNGKKSLFYHIMINYVDEVFEVGVETVNNLYNWETHSFEMETQNFTQYFIRKEDFYGPYLTINKKWYQEHILKAYPTMQRILLFSETYLKPVSDYDDIFTTWQKFGLQKEEEEQKLKDCYELLQQPFTTDIPAYYFAIKLNENGFCNITYTEYSSIEVVGTVNKIWKVNRIKKEWFFMITPDGKLYKKHSKVINRYYPMQLSDFYHLYKKENVCGEFVKMLLQKQMEEHLLYKDIMQDCTDIGCIIPLNLDEIAEYHTKSELLKKKYKKTSELNIKWNKLNINLSYLLIKAYSYLEPGISQRILLQQKTFSPFLQEQVAKSNRLEYRIRHFLSGMLYEKILSYEKKGEDTEQQKDRLRKELRANMGKNLLPEEEEEWIERELNRHTQEHLTQIQDYISMCRQTKVKIRFDIHSFEQLNNLHNRIAVNPDGYKKTTGMVKVPKKSKFLELRKILPEEFEWITTRKRLILETELQHHCVWSYAEKITKDKCRRQFRTRRQKIM